MQVIGMVSGDVFLSKYNISIPTDDFIETLRQFPSFWGEGDEATSFGDINGNWSRKTSAK